MSFFKVFLVYLNTFNFRAPFIFAPLIFAHPSKMNFRAAFNLCASRNLSGTFVVFLMKNKDKGKKETKLEL